MLVYASIDPAGNVWVSKTGRIPLPAMEPDEGPSTQLRRRGHDRVYGMAKPVR